MLPLLRVIHHLKVWHIQKLFIDFLIEKVLNREFCG